MGKTDPYGGADADFPGVAGNSFHINVAVKIDSLLIQVAAAMAPQPPPFTYSPVFLVWKIFIQFLQVKNKCLVPGIRTVFIIPAGIGVVSVGGKKDGHTLLQGK